jgi:regulator of replication initiation timing
MTDKEVLERKIDLKEQLIKLIEKEVAELKKQLEELINGQDNNR